MWINHQPSSYCTIHTLPCLSEQTINLAVIAQFIYCLYLNKPSTQQLLHNSYIAFMWINHQPSSYCTIHTLPCLYEQTINLAVIAQFIHCLYLNKPSTQQLLHNSYIAFIWINHQPSSYCTIHILPLSVQTMKPAVITQFIHCLYLYKPWNQQLLHNSYIAFIWINHQPSSYCTIHILPLSVQTMKPAVITQFIHCLYLYKPWNQQLLYN